MVAVVDRRRHSFASVETNNVDLDSGRPFDLLRDLAKVKGSIALRRRRHQILQL